MLLIAYCKRKQHRISVQVTRFTIEDRVWSRVYLNLSPSIPILHKSHSRFKGCFCNKQQFHLLFSPFTFGSWSFIAENIFLFTVDIITFFAFYLNPFLQHNNYPAVNRYFFHIFSYNNLALYNLRSIAMHFYNLFKIRKNKTTVYSSISIEKQVLMC